jgi:hypothetical protein
MAIFKKLMLLVATLAVAVLPFGFRFSENMNQTWVDLFGKGESLLVGVAFAADVLGRCFVQTKDRPTRIIIGLVAGLVCLFDLPFYGKASSGTMTASPESIAFWSLIGLAAGVILEIAVILEEEL